MERAEIEGWYTDDELALIARVTELATGSTEDGVVVEVGVYRGRSARVLDRHRNGRQLHLFDNLDMTTADTKQWPTGDGVYHHLEDPAEAEFVKLIALFHQDADHSFQAVLDHLEWMGPHVVKGGVIVLHDFGDPTYPGVARAWEMYTENKDFKFVDCAGHCAAFQRIK